MATGCPHCLWSMVENVDFNIVGPAAPHHFEKLISSHSYRGPVPGLTTSVICCVTFMTPQLQTSASSAVKAELYRGFTSPQAHLSNAPGLHQRPFLSLSLGVWNSHLDLILWDHPYQISKCCFSLFIACAIVFTPVSYWIWYFTLHIFSIYLSNAYSSLKKLNSTLSEALVSFALHTTCYTVLHTDSHVFSEPHAVLCSSSHHTVSSLSIFLFASLRSHSSLRHELNLFNI